MTCACVLIALCPLMAGCETRAAPTPPKALVASATPYVEIIDVATPDHRENRILRVEPADDDALFLQELYDFAIRYFPDGWWGNSGPDAQYREIVFFSRARRIVLRSWHPIVEQDSRLVAGSQGVTPLGGMTRQQFLARDDPAYVAQRDAFDAIEARLRERYGS